MFRPRKNTRLECYDYTWNGIYFVTVCTERRIPYLGNVVSGNMRLNAMGHIVKDVMHQFTEQYDAVKVYDYVIMPNHIHFLVEMGNGETSLNIPLSRFVGAIKGKISRVCKKAIWQRGFYERVIRDEQDLHNVQVYMQNNPLKWTLDKKYVPSWGAPKEIRRGAQGNT